MAGRCRIALRQVRDLSRGETIWDSAVAGFGARRQEGAIAYFLKYRNAAGLQRWYTIGRHGAPWTPETARVKAKEILGEVAKGRDPAAEKRSLRKATTVNDNELCDMYLADALAGRVLKRTGVGKKQSTLEIDKGRIERHIKPLLGARSVGAVTRHEIEQFLHKIAEGKTRADIKTRRRGLARVRGGKTAANRCVGLLGAIAARNARKQPSSWRAAVRGRQTGSAV
jgi:Arm DNA-binding domain